MRPVMARTGNSADKTATQRAATKQTAAMNKTATATHTQTRRQRRLAARRSRRPAAQGAPQFRLKPLTALIRATLPVTLLGLPAASLAGPEGGVVTAGSGTVARPDAQTTNIQQHSQNLILNWDSYNVQANEAVNYRQPNANAQALNRILDHNPSQIFGQINANGKVLLVNPNGVFFKPGARVNVGGLVASGLNISDKDFLAGKYHFAHDGKGAPGAVINQGLIQAATGGAVSLIGGAVKNEGTILAHAGQVNLVAGKAMTMDFDGDGLIQFAVTEELLERAEGLEDAVSNTGTIKAEGGAVLLKGRAARDVFTQVVNNSGVIGAGRVESNGGVIRLVAEGPGNSLLNTGTLNAASEKGAGGAVKLKAEGKVAVSGKARITVASGTGKGLPGAKQTGGRIDISGGDVAVSDSALITAASGVGQTQAGNALLNTDSGLRRAAPGVLPINDDGGGVRNGGQNNGEAKKSKGLAANKKPRHSSESWNPGKTTHSGPGRNNINDVRGGTIHIKAKNKAVVSGSAQITAASETGTGGHIQITGDKVGLLGLARLDASGAAAGGEILLGGDYQGKNPAVKNAKVTYVGKGARLNADAKTNGKGGRVIIWADDTTRYHGRISARGGPRGGAGGFVEVSGRRYLAFRGEVDVAAPKGRAGTLLLDPNDLCIGGTATSNSCGGTTASPTPEDTSNPFSAASATANSWVSQATLDAVGNANIILQATRDIFFDSNISLGSAATGYTGQFRLIAGRNIDMKGNNLTLTGTGASARFYAGGNIVLGRVSVLNGSIYLSANGAVTQPTVGKNLRAADLYLNAQRPANTGTGDFLTAQTYTGTYTLNTRNNAITNLHLGGTLGGNLRFLDNTGFAILGTGVNIGANSIYLNSSRAITQAATAVISGDGGLTKHGAGALTLSAQNTYKGDTRINAGTVNLNHTTGQTIAASTVRFTNNTTTTATLATTGNQTIGGLAGGNSNSKAQIQKNTTLTINSSGNTTFSGIIEDGTGPTGGGNLTIAGTRMLTLTNANTYTGVTTVRGYRFTGTGEDPTPEAEKNGSRLRIENASALGATSAGTVVENYASLILRAPAAGSVTFDAEPLTLQGKGARPGTSYRYGALRGERGNNIWQGPITLAANTHIRSGTAGKMLTINSNLSLQGTNRAGNIVARDLWLRGQGNITLAGLISGSGNLIGSMNNVNATLTLSRNRGTDATHTGQTQIRRGTVKLGADNALSTGSTLIVRGSAAVLDLAGYNAEIGGMQLINGTIRDNGRAADSAAKGALTLNNDGSTTRNFDLKNGVISAKLTGSAGLRKTTGGTVTLSGDNSFTGAVTVSRGVLSIASNNALGTHTSGTTTTVASGATLALAGGITVSAREALTLNGTGATANMGALHNISGGNTLSGTVALAGNTTITNANTGAGNTLTLGNTLSRAAGTTTTTNLTLAGAGNTLISGAIQTGAGGLSKTGGGTLTLSGTNTYTGATTVSGGTLKLGADNVVSDSSNLVVNGGTFDLDSYFDTVGGVQLTGGGSIIASGLTDAEKAATSTKGTLTLGGGSNFDLQHGTVSAKLAGGAGLNKTTGSTVTLSGDNSFSGAVTVSGGVLSIASNNALGATGASSGTTVNNAVLELAPSGSTNLNTAAEALTLNNGTLRNASGNNVWNGTINLTGAGTIDNQRTAVGSTQSLTLTANITSTSNQNLTVMGVGNTHIQGNIQTGTGSLTKTGGGTLTFRAEPIPIRATPTLTLANWNFKGGTALHDSSDVVLANTGSHKLIITNSETIASLAGGGAVEIANGRTLTVKKPRGQRHELQRCYQRRGAASPRARRRATQAALRLAATTPTAARPGWTRARCASRTTTPLGTPAASTAANTTTVARNATLELSGNGLNVAEALNLGGTLANPSGNNEYSGDIALTRAATLSSATAGNTLTVSGGVTPRNRRQRH